MSFLSSRQWALQEMLRGLSRDAGIFGFAMLLSALALSIPLFIATVFYGLSEPLRTLPTDVEITIFTSGSVKTDQVAKAVEPIKGVAQTQIIPKDQAYASLNDALGMRPKKGAANPLPDIVVARLTPQATSADAEAAAKAIEKIDGVDLVAYETSWHDKLRAVTDAAAVGLFCLGFVVLALVLLVLAASIRMTSLSAQNEMRALHLFGASPAFAIRPYAWRGIVLMAAASLAAIGITELGILMFGRAVAEAAALYEASIRLALPPALWLAIFTAGCAAAGGFVAAAAAGDAWHRIR